MTFPIEMGHTVDVKNVNTMYISREIIICYRIYTNDTKYKISFREIKTVYLKLPNIISLFWTCYTILLLSCFLYLQIYSIIYLRIFQLFLKQLPLLCISFCRFQLN